MKYSTALLLALVAACGSPKPGDHNPPAPINQFPGDLMSGAIPVFPLNVMRADSTIPTNDGFSVAPTSRARVDSIIHAVLQRRYPTVKWMTPADLRKAQEQAPQMLADPYQIPTLVLSTHALTTIPSQVLVQLRGLTAATSGGRYVVVPANLWLTKAGTMTKANLVVALADVRVGAVSWSGTLSGVGADPWTAINEAIVALTDIKERS
jgi:hypothetical protein